MTDYSKTVIVTWVPYRDAGDQTRDRFVTQGRQLGRFDDSPPDRWVCLICQMFHALDAIGIGTAASAGIPVCPKDGCTGFGWAQVRPVGPGEDASAVLSGL